MTFERITLIAKRVSISVVVLLSFLMFPLFTLGCISFYLLVPVTSQLKVDIMRVVTYAAFAALAVLAGFMFGAPGFFGVLAVPAAAIFWSILAAIVGGLIGVGHTLYVKLRKPATE